MMYEEFYSMTKTPFVRNVTTDAIYKTEQINNVINRLGYACRNKQFAILIGPSGAGKTTIIRYIKDNLNPADYLFMYMSERRMEPRMFYNRILSNLGYIRPHHSSTARIAVQREIEKLQGCKKIVVVIDDAHLLPYEMLDEIKFILNYKMDTENPFAFILSGNENLLKTLRTQSYSHTLNRVEMECFITALSLDETTNYIRDYVKYSGNESGIFSKDAINKIYKYSQGFPIRINRICTYALQLGAQCQRTSIDSDIIENVMAGEMTNGEM